MGRKPKEKKDIDNLKEKILLEISNVIKIQCLTPDEHEIIINAIRYISHHRNGRYDERLQALNLNYHSLRGILFNHTDSPQVIFVPPTGIQLDMPGTSLSKVPWADTMDDEEAF